jgi:hypothetical protein
MNGNASGSTLRCSLGCLLARKLGIALVPTGRKARLSFGSGESALNEWIEDNARVAWVEYPSPWEIESEVISALSPPLNLHHNRKNPFYPRMRALRTDAAQRARRETAASRNFRTY